MDELLAILRMRARAFGSGEPVTDWQRSCTYLPDGRIEPFRRYATLAAGFQAHDDRRICAALEAALDDLPPTGL